MPFFILEEHMRKNETYTAECVDYTIEGAGVVKLGDFVVFVPGLILHETAEIALTKVKPNYAYGRIVRLIQPSPHRIEPSCPVNRLCGGCQLMHMDREAQSDFKMRKVQSCFRANAGMEVEPLPIITAEPFDHYRNKVQIPVQVNEGRVEMGFYQKHTNRIIPFEQCQMESALSNEIVAAVKRLLEKHRCAKDVRHLLIKHAHASGQVMIVLIVRNRLKAEHEIADALCEQFAQVVSVQELINRRTDNVILDGETVLLKGKPYIEEVLLDHTFRISARSFYQINPYTTPLLYTKAIEAAQLSGREILVDLYCGTGTMGIIAAERAKKVFGIEIVPDAIRDARINAEINHVENIEFMTADAGQGANRILRSKLRVDAMIVDPPRRGCSPDTLAAIEKIAPSRLVYVSCDPATLARDVKLLTDGGYRMQYVQPVDMFPGTFHVETVALLTRTN